jgi:hypothetical protein
MGTEPRTTSDRCHKVESGYEDCVTGVTEIRELDRDERHTNVGCGRVDRIVILARCRLLLFRNQ